MRFNIYKENIDTIYRYNKKYYNHQVGCRMVENENTDLLWYEFKSKKVVNC